MSKTNEILRNQYLSHPTRHDIDAALETAQADASLQAVLARTPKGFEIISSRKTAKSTNRDCGQTAQTSQRCRREGDLKCRL
jgi:hypothetical protein